MKLIYENKYWSWRIVLILGLVVLIHIGKKSTKKKRYEGHKLNLPDASHNSNSNDSNNFLTLK